MPDTILTRPGADQGTDESRRAKLRQIIETIGEERHRLDGLTDGRERAQAELREARQQHAEQLQHLEQVRRDDPIVAAYRYVNHDLVGLNHRQAVEQAEIQVGKVQANIARLDEISAALDSEISRAEQRLRGHQSTRHEAMSEILINAPEFAALYDELGRAWVRLRTLRAACASVDRALHGYLPTRWQSRYLSVEPLDADRVGYPIDAELVESWAQAMQALREDAASALPTVG